MGRGKKPCYPSPRDAQDNHEVSNSYLRDLSSQSCCAPTSSGISGELTNLILAPHQSNLAAWSFGPPMRTVMILGLHWIPPQHSEVHRLSLLP